MSGEGGGGHPIHPLLQPTAPQPPLCDRLRKLLSPSSPAQLYQSLAVERRQFIRCVCTAQKHFPEHDWERNPKTMCDQVLQNKSYLYTSVFQSMFYTFTSCERGPALRTWFSSWREKLIPSKRQMLWLNWPDYEWSFVTHQRKTTRGSYLV